MVVYIAITSLLTMRISSYDWKMTANIDMRKQSWQCFMSLILPAFLIFRLYDTRFFLASFHVHIIITSLNTTKRIGKRFKYITYISWVFFYMIYSHVHIVAFTFQVLKVFIGIPMSCLQLQPSMLCNEMVFMRSWYAVIHW